MITLTVTSFNGATAGNLSFSFDETGGTIGRADTNQLVLPDPERAISRVHAQVAFRGGAYALIGRGANPILHNGKSLANGSEALLSPGDQIEIGSYRILVSSPVTAAASPDPFGAAFGDSVQPPPRAVPAAPKPLAPARPSMESSLGARAPAAPPAPPAAGIPHDWDPFAPHAPDAADPFGGIPGSGSPSPAPSLGAAPSARTPLPVSPPAADNSIDALFGLKTGAPSGDPFAASALATAGRQPNTADGADPLRSLQQTAGRPAPLPVSDHVSDLNAPWANAPQPAARSTPPSAPPPPPPQAPPPPAAALPGAVLSWDAPSREGKIVNQPAPPLAMPQAELPGAADRTMIARAAPAVAKAAEPARAPGGGATPNPLARDSELMAALLEGLGTPDLRTGPMSPELLHLIGQLLRESTKGTVELLAARAALKREVRADVTTIIANANNSLKFSPSAEVALQYMLGPRMGGFMAPVESMRDAYDDMRAHQLGIMAGMKAALAGVLLRFDPSVVEGKLTSRSALDSLLPSTRKAKLWERFQELYQQLATEAEEDFNTLFGAEFLKAYQHYVDQLEGKDTKG